eukprot:g2281.t1
MLSLMVLVPGGVVFLLFCMYFFLAAPKLPGKTPQPPTEFFMGNFTELDKNWDILQDWLLEKTKLFKWKTWGVSAPRLGSFSGYGAGVVISSPENVQHLLKDKFKRYEKTDVLTATLNELLGNGIFTSDNELWKFHRKVAAGMFSKRLLEYGTDTALTEAKKLITKLDAHCKSGEPVDLQQCFYAFTMDVFAKIAFGVEFNSQEKSHPFTVAFDNCQLICQNRFARPLWKLEKMFQLTEDERKVRRSKKVVKTFAASVINAKRRDAADGGGKALGPDLISRFLEGAIKRDQEITNKELTDVVLNFIIAGRDTTAAALSWTMFELLQRPDELDKTVRSIVEATGKDTPLEEMDSKDAFEQINGKLTYLKAVLSEGLRLHPSVAKDVKFCVEDDVFPDGTVVEKGMCVFYSPYIMGRNPNIWKDPLKFDASRWVAKKEGSGKAASLFKPTAVSDYKHAIFNAGPRLCLGRPLAYLEMQLILGILLPRYEFTPVTQHDGSYVQTIVAPMKGGFSCKVARR